MDFSGQMHGGQNKLPDPERGDFILNEATGAVIEAAVIFIDGSEDSGLAGGIFLRLCRFR